MGLFTKKKKAFDKPIEERSIPEIIQTVLHVNPMNYKSIIEEYDLHQRLKTNSSHSRGLLSTNKGKYWSNPHNQTSFLSGWFTHQDFVDWANGTGSAVRGDTQER